MKYYILDLTAQRSLVANLRDQGFEVFIISWKNPDKSDADLSMQDYIDQGVRAAIAQVNQWVLSNFMLSDTVSAAH